MRIVTRPDFDGIVCAVLISAAETLTDKTLWVEPGDMQHNKITIKKGDIIANLPYHPNCSFWFDHHLTNKPSENFSGAFRVAPSAAGVVYDYYKEALKGRFDPLVFQADKIDAADLSMAEIRMPEKYPYIILSMTLSGRNKTDDRYWDKLVALFLDGGIAHVMADDEVKKRIDDITRQNSRLAAYLNDHTVMADNISVTDFRSLAKAPDGNRFLVYTLFPKACASIKIRYDHQDPDKIILSIGHNIFNDTCKVNAGTLLSAYGGGGHFGAAACAFHKKHADSYIPEIIRCLNTNAPIA